MQYYFDIRKDGQIYKDQFGIELVSDAAACEEAQGLAVEIVKICGLEGDHSTLRIEAHRGDGQPFCVASFEMTYRAMQGAGEAERPGRATRPEAGMPLPPRGAGTIFRC